MSKQAPRSSYSAYVTGFVLSIICTLTAYFLTVHHIDSGHSFVSHDTLAYGLLALAVVQFAVQVIYFLHLGQEAKPRWNLMVFSFMALVVLIVVIGSLWIMANLDYRHQHMTPAEKDYEIIKEEGIAP